MLATERPPPRSLLPAPLRKPAAVAVVLCTAAFVGLALEVAGGSLAGPVDRGAAGLVRAAMPAAVKPLTQLTDLGDAGPVILAALALSLLALALGDRRGAALAIIGPLLTGVVTTGVKPLVGRTIRDHLAYPSGHTGAATALGLVTALVLIGLFSAGTAVSVLLLASGGLFAGGTMAVALVARGSHYPSDTVGGFCAAVVVVLGSALLIEKVAQPAAIANRLQDTQ
ncbi:MAG: phosphatase PAP2 family protein [Pseudonocardia sp.]